MKLGIHEGCQWIWNKFNIPHQHYCQRLWEIVVPAKKRSHLKIWPSSDFRKCMVKSKYLNIQQGKAMWLWYIGMHFKSKLPLYATMHYVLLVIQRLFAVVLSSSQPTSVSNTKKLPLHHDKMPKSRCNDNSWYVCMIFMRLIKTTRWRRVALLHESADSSSGSGIIVHIILQYRLGTEWTGSAK